MTQIIIILVIYLEIVGLECLFHTVFLGGGGSSQMFSSVNSNLGCVYMWISNMLRGSGFGAGIP